MPTGIYTRPDALNRFMAKIEVAPNGCWLWTGALKPNGYGYMGLVVDSKKTVVYIHRWAYEFWIGPIPAGKEIDHTCHSADLECRNGAPCLHRRCGNPDHIEAVTHQENKDRALVTRCTHGHLYDEVNTYRRADGHRECRACGRASAAARRIARMAMASSHA